MPYCENCGSQVNPNAKFCGNCGAAQNQQTASQSPVNAQPKPQQPSYYSPPSTSAFAPPPPPPPMMQAPPAQEHPKIPPAAAAPALQTSSESTIGVILLRKPKSLGRYDTYTGVLTNQRVIFAQMTSEMLTQAAQQAKEQAKAEGKGFWGQWSEQLKGTFGYTKKYLTIPPQAILAETPGNFALNNNAINEVKVHLKGANQQNQRRELEVEFCSNSGKHVFRMDENSDFTGLLKQVYGDRVKMPFGYFSKSINIKL
ncbi:MAG: zinc ribbon domain-containing protein [Candidatus Bathyarchaeota archaeon]|nr:zinc ribbon domain-containing protein [Candidatus Bathyarchaeota archaeon]